MTCIGRPRKQIEPKTQANRHRRQCLGDCLATAYRFWAPRAGALFGRDACPRAHASTTRQALPPARPGHVRRP